MLDMGFIPDIEKICKLLPPRRQTLFFSATMPPEIQRLVDQFLNDPARIEVARPATAAQTITQRFQFCTDGEDWAKREMLRDLIHGQDVQNAIIFCNRKRDVAILHKSLIKHGFNAGALHGDMDQSNRTATLDKFRNGEITILAASDVAARGLDIPEVSHVFNFDVPWVGDDYVHRIGRTGRAGREGYAATLVAPDDLKLLQGIESVTGEKAVWIGDAPTEEDFAESGKKRRGRGGRGNSSSSRSSSSTGRGRRPSRDKSQESEPEEAANAQPSRRRSTRSTPLPVELDAEQASNPRRRRARKPDAEIPGSGEQPIIDANALAPVPVEEVVPASKSRSRNAPDRTTARPERERPSRARARPQDDRSNAPAGGNSNSFHEGNLPAFLQRPVRPEKPAKKPGRTAREEPTAEIDG